MGPKTSRKSRTKVKRCEMIFCEAQVAQRDQSLRGTLPAS